MAVPAAALSRTLGPKGPPWRGADGAARRGGAGDRCPCSAHALPVAPGGPSGDQLPGGHRSRLWGAAQPTSPRRQRVSPRAAATETSPGVRPGSGLGLNVTRKWYWFPQGRYSSLRMAFLCIMFSGIPLVAFPPAFPTPERAGPDASLGIYSNEFWPLETHLQIQSSKALISAIPLVD